MFLTRAVARFFMTVQASFFFPKFFAFAAGKGVTQSVYIFYVAKMVFVGQ